MFRQPNFPVCLQVDYKKYFEENPSLFKFLILWEYDRICLIENVDLKDLFGNEKFGWVWLGFMAYQLV